MQRERHKASIRSLPRSRLHQKSVLTGEPVEGKYSRITFLNSQSPPRIPAALTIWRSRSALLSTQRQNQHRRVSALFKLAASKLKGGRLKFGRSELKHRTEFAGNALRENSIHRLSPPGRNHQTPPPS
jgi:hypothetical protein